MGCAQSGSQPISTIDKSIQTPPVEAPKEKIEPPVPPPPETKIDFKPIHSAFRWNKTLSEIEPLLNSNAAINVEDESNGNLPVHIAAQNGHLELVHFLIKRKANLNAQNHKGNTALHMSIGYDYYETSLALIQAGADLNIVNEAGFPAKLGLDGDKTLGIIALLNAKTSEEVTEAFKLCEKELSLLNKVNFAQAGFKAKKSLEKSWTPEFQEKFKSIMNKLS